METPYTDHLSAEDYAQIYEPAEDTFLLLDALEDDIAYLENLQPRICLEIGAGSGVIISALAKRFPESLCLATDINMHACRATMRTAARNGAKVDSVHGNLVDTLRPHSVDVLLFNPPYVVTTDQELQQPVYSETVTNRNLVYSWAGGLDGRRVTDAILEKIDAVLAPNGVFYLLLLQENKPDDVITRLKQLQFTSEKFKERRIPGEYLYILKITRTSKKQ